MDGKGGRGGSAAAVGGGRWAAVDRVQEMVLVLVLVLVAGVRLLGYWGYWGDWGDWGVLWGGFSGALGGGGGGPRVVRVERVEGWTGLSFRYMRRQALGYPVGRARLSV